MVLKELEDIEREAVLPYLKKVSLKKGEMLFQPAKEADGVFFLETGRLGVQTETGFEDKQQVVALLDPGAPVGEKGLARKGESRGMSVVAIEDATLFFLSMGDFEAIEREKPTIAIKILKKLLYIASLRLQNSSVRLAHVL